MSAENGFRSYIVNVHRVSVNGRMTWKLEPFVRVGCHSLPIEQVERGTFSFPGRRVWTQKI